MSASIHESKNVGSSMNEFVNAGMLASPVVLDPSPDAPAENHDHSHTTSDYCTYRNCRHSHQLHGKSWTVNGKKKSCRCKNFTARKSRDSQFKDKVLDANLEEFLVLTAVMDTLETFCDCGEPRRSYDIKQEFQQSAEGKREIMTYHECPKCGYGLQPWKIGRRITREQIKFLEEKGIKLPAGWALI